jgi:putative SOS response-associated peptidase YedK
MCGRFALHTPRSRIASRYFDIQLPVGDVHASYNITPGIQITASTRRQRHQ